MSLSLSHTKHTHLTSHMQHLTSPSTVSHKRQIYTDLTSDSPRHALGCAAHLCLNRPSLNKLLVSCFLPLGNMFTLPSSSHSSSAAASASDMALDVALEMAGAPASSMGGGNGGGGGRARDAAGTAGPRSDTRSMYSGDSDTCLGKGWGRGSRCEGEGEG